jgi:putative transposase
MVDVIERRDGNAILDQRRAVGARELDPDGAETSRTPGKDDRRFFEAVVWWRRTGVPWRDLPGEFGPWKTVFNRFDRWSKCGRWDELFAALQTDVDREWQSIDSTANRAHQHAAGGKGGPRSTGSVGHGVAQRRKSTSSSTRWDSRSPLK